MGAYVRHLCDVCLSTGYVLYACDCIIEQGRVTAWIVHCGTSMHGLRCDCYDQSYAVLLSVQCGTPCLEVALGEGANMPCGSLALNGSVALAGDSSSLASIYPAGSFLVKS